MLTHHAGQISHIVITRIIRIVKQEHQYYMNQAIAEAKKASAMNEVPVGAIIVQQNGEIISRAYNLRESDHCATAHAELLAIESACAYLSQWRLSGCTLYVTLEPCFMCAGAIVLARIPTVVYGASDPKTGAVKSLANVLSDTRLNHTCEIIEGVCEEDASSLLKNFFKKKRKKIGIHLKEIQDSDNTNVLYLEG